MSTRPVRALMVALFAALCLTFLPTSSIAAVAFDPEGVRVAPYAVTPDAVVDEMLQLANVGPDDYVVDLGSGDGRLVIRAVQHFHARGGFGVDISDKLVAYANAWAAEQKVNDRVQFFVRDLFATDVRPASVVTIYLFPKVMDRVGEKLRGELAPGTRVVSHDFPLPGWPIKRIQTVAAPEKNDTTGRREAVLFLYVVPPP